LSSSSAPSPESAAGAGQLLLDEPAPGVTRLTISNPGKRGALDHAILGAFTTLLPQIDARCLIITGEERTFSAGYDLSGAPGDEVAPAVFVDAAEKLIAHPFTAAIEAIEAFPYPTVAALNGHAIGGGLELAISCDLRVAAEGIKLGMPPGKLGLVYSHTGLRKFIDVVGAPRTRDLFLTGRRIDAGTAHQWGLVNDLVPYDSIATHAEALASEIAGNAPLAQKGNKRVIEAILSERARLDPAVERELIEIRRACFQSEDFREGVRAFSEKRPPVWRGR
jgi:enoyl-CoA hydratase/carnithine racemase